MISNTYTVKVGSQKVAQHMPIDIAMLLVEAMFDHWFNATNLAITIEREENTTNEKVETQSDKVR